VEIKCQLDATDGFFIADLTACSTFFGHHYAHHQELKSIIHVVEDVIYKLNGIRVFWVLSIVCYIGFL